MERNRFGIVAPRGQVAWVPEASPDGADIKIDFRELVDFAGGVAQNV